MNADVEAAFIAEIRMARRQRDDARDLVNSRNRELAQLRTTILALNEEAVSLRRELAKERAWRRRA